jgi:hypothetical protein
MEIVFYAFVVSFLFWILFVLDKIWNVLDDILKELRKPK